jgi:iron complex transport system ATP-binding protein
MSLLALKDVSFSFPGGAPLLAGLDFAVEKGSVSAVLGPNGCGKTTLMDICMGWRKPDAGAVLLDDRPLARWSRRERARTVGLVPQREEARFDFTVHEYVMLGRAPHIALLAQPGPADDEAVHAALEEVGIRRFARRSASTLSGGEFRLMLIARSLCQRPSLLLLDEPAGHLDPANSLLVVRLLEKLRHSGLTILYTSHDPQTAALSADAIHLLRGGRILRSGSPRNVITEDALGEVYGIPARVDWIGESPHIRWGG